MKAPKQYLPFSGRVVVIGLQTLILGCRIQRVGDIQHDVNRAGDN